MLAWHHRGSGCGRGVRARVPDSRNPGSLGVGRCEMFMLNSIRLFMDEAKALRRLHACPVLFPRTSRHRHCLSYAEHLRYLSIHLHFSF